ncbi:TerC family protein [Bythopirellula polymerisocia]|uniref:Integral membrane protein TerC family protein n=1 Tax=Bythopirellula polymerisocia TaxID=2528003 RepID=A0A5C6CTY4_9BACT|nr:TerC family protein [Bythopirellula polymerisocia]TWU27868.1 Integral membrane protein TerC family protein [Bythopirellula polymerisocia]
MEELFTTHSMLSLATLTILEIVLGIDNIVFLAILTGKLPEKEQPRARTIGLMLAALGRIALLFAITWIITLDKTVLFDLPFNLNSTDSSHAGELGAMAETTPITIKSLVLLLGGLFLVGKATWEIGHQLDPHDEQSGPKAASSLTAVLVQIFLIDLVFSLDSVLTAVGMVRPEDYSEHWVPMTIMVTAVLVSIGVMLAFSGPVSRFVNQHPSIKMLALAFLILIGVVLIAEGLNTHIPRGYIYSPMAFSLFVEMLNLRASRRSKEHSVA